MTTPKLRVHDGTRSELAPRLCDSCESGVVTRGGTGAAELVFCQLMDKQLSQRVTECSRYADRSAKPLWALREIAWILDVDRRRERVGFLRASEWLEKNPNADLTPGF